VTTQAGCEAAITGMIEPEQQAPNFELPDQGGRAVKLSDFRDKSVVVYFYPKADTRL
jgi:peroxiredoxin Q/BCP